MRTVIYTSLALLLLLTALTQWRAARNEARAEAAYPPEGEFLEIDGQRIHYVMAGSGPDLVLIHGASGNTREFTFRMRDALSDRYRVIIFDRPGLGYSDPLDGSDAALRDQALLLQRAAARLGADRPLVLGQSYGGSVALAWAVHAPEHLAGLTLVSAASNPWSTGLGTYYTVLSSWWGQRFVIPLLTAFVPPRVVDNTINEVFLPETPPEGYHDYIGAGLTLRRPAIRANALQRAALLDGILAQQPRYGNITQPVEIIHGSGDTTVPLSVHSEPLSRQIENANLTILDGAGHMPHHTAMPAVIEAVDRTAARAGLN